MFEVQENVKSASNNYVDFEFELEVNKIL